MNLKDVLTTPPFNTATFLRTDPHYCIKFWEPLVMGERREINEECNRFISNMHGKFNKIVPALYQDMACACLAIIFVALTTFAKMIDMYTEFWFVDRYDAGRIQWDLHMELPGPQTKLLSTIY